VSKVSPLKRTTEVVSHRHGGDPSSPFHSPGQSKYEAITMERGVSTNHEFEEWAERVYTPIDGRVSLEGYKKNLIIEVLDIQGSVALKYNVRRAWVSEYTAVAELDANANAVLFESIVIQNEGFSRDTAYAVIMLSPLIVPVSP
jgi:phage tail-like protein